ncbi:MULTISPECIES: sugar ABC transporter permease [Clostridium]|uniref:carbohydrate ABC transporter permease n=1 Tax=Clostridium TaxID=1485 RepID=UPI002908949C|nr:sugar ABC transporter permease [Clostridium sp.]MDU4737259.1 sugar ABC transporter permease [Clostridium sp.]
MLNESLVKCEEKSLINKKSIIKNKKIKYKKFMGKISPFLFLLPGIIFTLWLRYIPIFKSFYMSLFRYDAINPPGEFVGLKNYANLFQTQFYWDAWKNTFVFLILSLTLVFFVPIIQALFLNEILKGKKLFTTIYLVTALIPMSVNVIIWKWIWSPDYGLANQILKFFGAEPQLWLSNPDLTKFAIIFPGVIGGGIAVLMYTAAIQGIPAEIFEAAELDGCTGFKKIRHIILPNIIFIIIIQLVLAVIGAMQILDAPYQFASGGPSGSSTSMGIFIYNAFKQDLDYGKGAAASMILFVVIAIMTIFQMKLDKSERN